MANPEHIPDLDAHDRRTVGLYRAGLAVATAGLCGLAGALLFGSEPGYGLAGVLAGTLLATVHLHLYDKRVRWAIQGAGGLGAWLMGAGALVGAPLAVHAGLGVLFVALSGLALKERFCFRIPGLRAVPALLAASLVPLVLGFPVAAGLLLGAAAIPLGVLVLAKLRQPLHFDVGDRSRYQV